MRQSTNCQGFRECFKKICETSSYYFSVISKRPLDPNWFETVTLTHRKTIFNTTSEGLWTMFIVFNGLMMSYDISTFDFFYFRQMTTRFLSTLHIFEKLSILFFKICQGAWTKKAKNRWPRRAVRQQNSRVTFDFD